MFLPKDRFHVAADEVEDDHIAHKTEDAGMQEHRAEKLPGVGLIDAAIAEAQILGDSTGLIGLDNLLRDKNGEINSD